MRHIIHDARWRSDDRVQCSIDMNEADDVDDDGDRLAKRRSLRKFVAVTMVSGAAAARPHCYGHHRKLNLMIVVV